MLPSSFKQASLLRFLFDGAERGPMLAGMLGSNLDSVVEQEPQPLPLGVALALIAALSLALWAGVGLLFAAFIFR